MKTLLLCIGFVLLCPAAHAMPLADTISHKEIYEIMRVVIEDQKLLKGMYLDPVAASHCSTSDDSSYLYTLDSAQITIKEADKKFRDTCMTGIKGAPFDIPLERISFTIGDGIPPCLSKGDIAYMLEQREKVSAFKWDKKKLGFNKKATYNYYYISVPLFSLDKTKALLMIEELCPGLCGQGHTLLYTLRNGKWIAQSSSTWHH